MIASKEKEFLKKLLDDHGISATITEEADVGWFTITFTTRKNRGTFKQILSEKRIDFAEEGKTALFVLVAFPDILLEKERDEETEEQKKMRLIKEYEQRLLLIFKMMKFTVHILTGPKHKGENHASISGNNGKRRIDFCGSKNKQLAESILVKAGFHCVAPPNKEKHTLIVDLEASKHGVLVQEIEELITPRKHISENQKTEKMLQVEKPKVALSDIKKILRENNIQPETHIRKDQKITLNVSAGGATLGIQKIIEKFGISAVPSPRGTSIVLNESEVSVEERNPRQKKEVVPKKQNLLSVPDAITQLHLCIQNEVKSTRTEMEKEFILVPKKGKDVVSIPLAKFADKIIDGNIQVPLSFIQKVLLGQ